MESKNLIANSWEDYELLDSGDNYKLERFGPYIISRPETQAIWKPKNPKLWEQSEAKFVWDGGKGKWIIKKAPETWQMSWNDLRFTLKLTGFKHLGIFPEQAANWQWLQEKVRDLKNPQILNLFAYTGISSLALAQSGAQVTHVDASKQSNNWARDNAKLSNLPEDSIRYILDDAVKFATREARRGTKYDGIILDPPAFGRGVKSEIWRIEEDLRKLLEITKDLLSTKKGSFFLLNGYAAGYSPVSFQQAVQDAFPNAKGEFGELHIQEKDSTRRVPSGIYTRFTI